MGSDRPLTYPRGSAIFARVSAALQSNSPLEVALHNARAIAERDHPAVVAACGMPAQGSGATLRDGLQHPVLLGREPMGGAIRVPTSAHDISHLQRRVWARRRVGGARHCSARCRCGNVLSQTADGQIMDHALT